LYQIFGIINQKRKNVRKTLGNKFKFFIYVPFEVLKSLDPDPHSDKTLDPDPHEDLSGSEALLNEGNPHQPSVNEQPHQLFDQI